MEDSVKISYNPLWQTIADRGIRKNQFRLGAKISSSTYTKLINNDCITTDTLLKIANYLSCNVSEIVEFKDVNL
nr:helix-turn-helix transcriptional regulator [Streptococcus sp. SM5]